MKKEKEKEKRIQILANRFHISNTRKQRKNSEKRRRRVGKHSLAKRRAQAYVKHSIRQNDAYEINSMKLLITNKTPI